MIRYQEVSVFLHFFLSKKQLIIIQNIPTSKPNKIDITTIEELVKLLQEEVNELAI